VTVATTTSGLTLVSATANAGYTVGQRSTSASRIDVVFRSASGSSWIRVDLVDGQAQPTTGESSGSTDHSGSRRPGPSTTTSPPTTDSARAGVSYPAGRDGTGGTTDGRTSYRHR
jgi:hypothetical protein